MAGYNGIAAVGKALVALLEDAVPRDLFPGAHFLLAQAADFRRSQSPVAQGLAVYLYRLEPNGTARNSAPRVDRATGRRFKPSLAVDLHYLLMPYAETAETQHQLLAWAMRALEDTPVLHAGLLNDQDVATLPFAADESVDVVCEPLTIRDLIDAQEPLKPHVQLAAAYVVRRVLIDSPVELPEFGPVQTRKFDYAEATGR